MPFYRLESLFLIIMMEKFWFPLLLNHLYRALQKNWVIKTNYGINGEFTIPAKWNKKKVLLNFGAVGLESRRMGK